MARWAIVGVLSLIGCGGPQTERSPPEPQDAASEPPEAPPPPRVPVRVDLHVDTPSRLVDESLSLDDPALEAGLPRLTEGGVNLVVQALWPGRAGDTAGRVDRLLARLIAEDERLPRVTRARSPHEALTAIADGRIALVVGLEGAHGLREDWRVHLEQLDGEGLRVLGLTWSVSNRFAGSSGDGGGGVTDEGRLLLAEAWRRGMVVDLSHASRQATLDVCGAAPVPVIASHSNAHAVCGVARNLTDEEIRCIAATGGVIGPNLHAPFLCGDRDLDAVVRHLEHLAAVGGHGVVSLSTDFDGRIELPRGLEHAGRIPELLAALAARGWTEAQLEGLEGANFLRAWREAAAGTPR